MNKEYTLKKENQDYFLLEQFNEFLNLQELGRCPEKHTTDASGYTVDGRLLNIELKQRNQTLINNFTVLSGLTTEGKTYTANTIFIEAHKAGDLYLDYVCEDKIPMYINFLNDGYVIVYNLARLKHRPTKIAKRIYSHLYDGFELAKREELRLEDAWIYKKENNAYKLVHKPL